MPGQPTRIYMPHGNGNRGLVQAGCYALRPYAFLIFRADSGMPMSVATTGLVGSVYEIASSMTR